MKFFTVFFSVLLLISTLYAPLGAQSAPGQEQEEAPATVWDMQLGDADVDLYIAGYWKIGIAGGVSMESGPDGIVFPAAFPGLTDFKFYQEPDITISLWLKNRFYLETTFLEGFDRNTYAMGYRGMEGEPVQSVRIGNSDISMDKYEGISVPAPKYNTPGISASFQTDISKHEVVVRYDPTSEHKKVFLGEYEVNEEIIEVGAYERGRFFILPDENLDYIEVYIADKSGIYSDSDGKKYRKATESDYSVSLSRGTLALAESAASDVVVYYTSNGGTAVGISTASQFIAPLVNGEPDPSGTSHDFSWSSLDYWNYTSPITEKFQDLFAININSRKALRLYTPGKFDPFEMMNRYGVKSNLPEEQWRTDVFLADNSFLEADDSEDYEYQLDRDSKLLTLLKSSDADIRSPWSRYPLAEKYSVLYGGEEKDRAQTGRSILVSTKSGSGLTLGPGVVNGSVSLTINGYETGAVDIDYATGEMSFNRYIYPYDRIEVTFRTETTDLSGGDILVAQGNRFYPNENLELHLAEMFRWNVAKSTSTTDENSSPGGLTVAGGLKYNRENLHMDLTALGELTTPDTTGYLRLMGMEESGFDFPLSKTLAVPSTGSIWDGSADLSAGRVDLLYTDFYSTDGLGHYFLNSYNWPSASVDSSLEGPSVASRASGDDDFSGNVMVLDYNLASGEWSAGDLLLSADGPVDLSGYTSMSLWVKTLDSTGSVTVSLLLGENGESEDFDDDGFDEPYDESLIVNFDTVSLPGSDNQWKELPFTFSASQMKKLTKSRSLRVLIEGLSAGTSGRLLVGGIHFEGSLFDGTVYNSGGIEYATEKDLDIEDTNGSAAQQLLSDFDEVRDLFHSADEEQKALKIAWGQTTPLIGTDYWTAQTNTAPVSPDDYGTFNFYINADTDAASAGVYDIELTDSRNRGFSFGYDPSGTTGWKKISLSLEDGTISDEAGNDLGTAVMDSNMGQLSRFSIKSPGSMTGTIYLDELHYSDPLFSLKGSVEFNTDYSYPDIIAETAGGFTLLSDFSLSNQFRYSGGTVLSEQSEGFNNLENYSEFAITAMMLDLSGTIKVNWNRDATDFAGSHSLLFPSGFPYASISDSYSRSGSGENSSFSRSNVITGSIIDVGNVTLSTSSEGSSEKLIQNWKTSTRWKIGERINLSAEAGLDQYSLWDHRDRGNYFSNWIADYSLLIPATEDVKSRGFRSSLSFSLTPEPVGLSFTPRLAFTAENQIAKAQTDSGGFSLSLPVSIVDSSDRIWKLIPSYSRSFSGNRETDSTASFGDGFSNMASDLSKWMPLTSFIPFQELFATGAAVTFEEETSFLDNASYNPEFALLFTREYGSELYDIFIPYSFQSLFSREFSKKDDSLSSSSTFTFTVKQAAINLFGRFGVHEHFDFYDSEDISSSLQFSLTGDDGAFPSPSELVYQDFLSFYGKNNSALTFENRFEANFADTFIRETLDGGFFWKGDMLDSFRLKFLNGIIKKQHFWSHEEKLKITVGHPWAESGEMEYTYLDLAIQHQSKVNVPDLGSLRGYITFGFYRNEALYRLGFEAGLELEMSF